MPALRRQRNLPTNEADVRVEGEPRTVTSSLARVFELFDAFSLDRPLLRVEDLAAKGRYTRSTAYRYVKHLCDAGFLAPSHGGLYSLGPRIIELERLLKLTDPLYRAGTDLLSRMRRDDSVLVLCNLYGDRVLCIHHEGPDSLRLRGKSISVLRSRGVAYPLFQGSGSLALLANLSSHRIQQTYLKFAPEIAKYRLGRTWDEYRANLTRIRRQGYATTAGQVTPHTVGVAVPILLPHERQVVGSLTRVLAADSIDTEEAQRLAAGLTRAATRIAARVDRAG